jgi:NAD-dependent dihydropyrimidine dehydrogenase PreA subunit
MKLSYLKNVTSLVLLQEKCIGCGKREQVCPHGVFNISQGKAQLVEKDLCIECGACALNCPAKALSVNAGVGCAAAIIFGWFTGKEPSCDCEESECC